MNFFYPAISFGGINRLNGVDKKNAKVDNDYKLLREVKIGNDTASLYELKNGHKIIILPCKGESLVQTFVNVGSFNENDNNRGISHFIEHTVISGGSKNLEPNGIWKIAQDTVAETNALTGPSKTSYYFSSYLFDDKDLEKQIKTQAQVIKDPIFRQDRINNEKHAVKEEILMGEKNDFKRAGEAVIVNLLGIKTQDEIVAGNTKNIDNLKREDIVNFHKKHYTPSDFVTLVSGDINKKNALNLVAKYFGTDEPKVESSKKYYQPVKPLNKTISREFKVKTPFYDNITLRGFSGSSKPEEKLIVGMINAILNSPGSKLFEQRQKNGSEVNLSFFEYGHSDNLPESVLSLNSSVAQEHEAEFNKALSDEITKIKNGDISLEKFNNIKRKFIYNTKRAEADGNTGKYIASMLLSENPDVVLDYLSNKYLILENLTIQDLSDYAKKYLDFNKMSSVKLVSAGSNEIPQKVSFGANRNLKLDYGNVKTVELRNNILLNEKNTETVGTDLNIDIRKCLTKRKLPDNPILMELLQNIIEQEIEKNKNLYDELAMNFDFKTDGYRTVIKMNCPDESTDKAINIIVGFLLNPEFSVNDFENVKSIMKKALETMVKINKPGTDDAKDRILFPNSGVSLSPKEALEYLNKLTFDDIKNSFSTLIENSDCAVSLSSETEQSSQRVKDGLEKFHKFLKFQPADDTSLEYEFTPLQKETSVGIKDENSKKAEITQYFKYPEITEPKSRLTVLVTDMILSGLGIENSRLLKDFREDKGMCYSVRSIRDKYGKNDVFAFKISTSVDGASGGSVKNVSKSLNGFKEHVEKLCNEFVTDDELKFAKNMLKKRLFDLNSSERQKLSRMTEGLRHNEGTRERDNDTLKLIDTITKEDIKRVSRIIFKSSKPLNIVKAAPETLELLGIKTFEYNDKP